MDSLARKDNELEKVTNILQFFWIPNFFCLPHIVCFQRTMFDIF